MKTTPSLPPTFRRRRSESGQAMLLIAASFIGMAAFIGLAIDLGILIVAQAHLQRAVDAAAIAAATQIREAQPLSAIGPFANQFITLNNTDTATVIVQQCRRQSGVTSVDEFNGLDNSITNYALADLDASSPAYQLCAGEPRKQIRVQASARVQFTFLTIIGFSTTDISVDAVSEAATVDMVLVFATGETMGQSTYPLRGDGLNTNYGPLFNPLAGQNPGCNANAGPEAVKDPENGDNPAKCRPLWDAKQAGKRLVGTLYSGFDRVGVVGYDFNANVYSPLALDLGVRAVGGSDSTGVYAAIDSLVLKNDVPPTVDYGFFSPLNIDCISGNPAAAACQTPDPSRSAFSNCAGCGIRVATNLLKMYGRPEALWVIVFLSDGYANLSDVPDEFVAASLHPHDTPSEVDDIDAAGYPNGYCAGQVGAAAGTAGSPLWTRPVCLQGGFDLNGNGNATDAGVVSPTLPTLFGFPWSVIPLNETEIQNPNIRFCGPYHVDPDAPDDPQRSGQGVCPPGAIFVGEGGITNTAVANAPVGATLPYQYNVFDYARDMVDAAALTVKCVGVACSGGVWPPNGHVYNQRERAPGGNITIYSIGLGATVVIPPDYSGERLLRYMAAVGDDGDRVTDPCTNVAVATSCGNYYFAPDPSALGPVFEDIAKRIFTRLTR